MALTGLCAITTRAGIAINDNTQPTIVSTRAQFCSISKAAPSPTPSRTAVKSIQSRAPSGGCDDTSSRVATASPARILTTAMTVTPVGRFKDVAAGWLLGTLSLVNSATANSTPTIGSAKITRQLKQKAAASRRILSYASIGVWGPCSEGGRKAAITAAGRINIPPISTTDKMAAVL